LKKNNKLLENLYSLVYGGMTHNTKRAISLLEALNNPHKSYPIVHIAGTNGKGSVCSLLASILKECGFKVGLYTSPHITEFNERIRVNGKSISDKEIETIFSQIEEYSFKIEASFFEITSTIAFEHFKNKEVDIAIIETGLGGNYDSTNVVAPILSIITAINIDHSNILGNSLEQIANEKAGIIKENCPVLVQSSNHIQVLDIMQEKAREMHSEIYFNYYYPTVELIGYSNTFNMHLQVGLPTRLDDFIKNKHNKKEHSLHLETKYPIKYSMLGKHQIHNIQTAIFASLLISNQFPISSKGIINGISNVSKNTGLKYRIECVRLDPLIILDVSHNPQSINMLTNTLKMVTPQTKWNFIFGAMHDKDIKTMLEYIYPFCNKLSIVSPNIRRAAKVDEIEKIAKSIGFSDVVMSNDINIPVKSINEPTVICGSFYVIEEVVSALRL
jgi:dihydrofolate synthase/folylpolyglutamate synthase